MSELSAHEVLVKARNLIDRHGWIQNTVGCPETGFCVVGAVRYAATGTAYGDCPDQLYPIAPAIREAIGTANEVAWNNAPGRTKVEVLAAFDRAISATAPAPADPLEGVEMAEMVV